MRRFIHEVLKLLDSGFCFEVFFGQPKNVVQLVLSVILLVWCLLGVVWMRRCDHGTYAA